MLHLTHCCCRVTGSHDCTIRVWDLTSFSCITTINAHQGETRIIMYLNISLMGFIGPITCLDYNDKILVTGSSDKCVYVKMHHFTLYICGTDMSKHGAVIHMHNLE